MSAGAAWINIKSDKNAMSVKNLSDVMFELKYQRKNVCFFILKMKECV